MNGNWQTIPRNNASLKERLSAALLTLGTTQVDMCSGVMTMLCVDHSYIITEVMWGMNINNVEHMSPLKLFEKVADQLLRTPPRQYGSGRVLLTGTE